MSGINCEWCGEPTTELTYLQKDGADRHIHHKCYALMYNYARRFQELKELLIQPDFVEVHESKAAPPTTEAEQK